MSATPVREADVLLLRAPTANETASANGTEMVNARLATWVSGFIVLAVATLDFTTGDEAYTFAVQGRETSGDSYVTIASIPLGAATGSVGTVVGLYLASVDRFYKRMRVVTTLAGTTPIVLYTICAVATKVTYGPAGNAIIA